MSRPAYRLEAGLVRELAVCAAHAHNGDEIGLSDRQKVIARVIRRLTPRQRECMQLYFARGLTMEQIARLLGVHTSTVCRAIRRGVDTVRRFLALVET